MDGVDTSAAIVNDDDVCCYLFLLSPIACPLRTLLSPPQRLCFCLCLSVSRTTKKTRQWIYIKFFFYCVWLCIYYIFPSVLCHCWLDDGKGIQLIHLASQMLYNATICPLFQAISILSWTAFLLIFTTSSYLFIFIFPICYFIYPFVLFCFRESIPLQVTDCEFLSETSVYKPQVRLDIGIRKDFFS